MERPRAAALRRGRPSERTDRNRLLSFIVDLLTVRVVYGIVIIAGLGLTIVGLSFAGVPPGQSESFGRFVVRQLGAGLLVTAVTSGFLQLVIVGSQGRFQRELDIFVQDDLVAGLDAIRSDVTKELDEIRRELDTVITGRREVGLAAFHSTVVGGRFDFAAIFRKLRPGDELLWLDTYAPTFREFEEPLIEALNDGAMIRMLVIDPHCANAAARAREIRRKGFDEPTFVKEVQEFRDLVLNIVREVPHARESCRIRVYDDLPCIPMYIISRGGKAVTAYTSFFLTEPTAYFVHLEWQNAPKGLLPFMKSYFDQKWDAHPEHEYPPLQT